MVSTGRMSEDALVRLENLKRLKHDAAFLSKNVGGRVSYWHDLLAGNKSFGEKAARKIEAALGLARCQLDTPASDPVKVYKQIQPLAITDKAQVATNGIATLGECMAFLATYLSGLEMSDREKAMRDIGDLVKEPETHKKVTAAIEARVGAAFAQSDRRAA